MTGKSLNLMEKAEDSARLPGMLQRWPLLRARVHLCQLRPKVEPVNDVEVLEDEGSRVLNLMTVRREQRQQSVGGSSSRMMAPGCGLEDGELIPGHNGS